MWSSSFPSTISWRDKGGLRTRRGEAGSFDKGTSLHTQTSPSWLSLPSPHCLLQVHKFLNRNRDDLDPAVVEMLAQSQLQVPLQPFLGPQPSTLSLPILPLLPGHCCSKGSPSISLAPWGGQQAGLWTGRVGELAQTPLSPQLVGSLFQEAEPQAGGGQGKPTLASRFQQSLEDLLARLGR